MYLHPDTLARLPTPNPQYTPRAFSRTRAPFFQQARPEILRDVQQLMRYELIKKTFCQCSRNSLRTEVRWSTVQLFAWCDLF
jgi:hypothetical protein